MKEVLEALDFPISSPLVNLFLHNGPGPLVIVEHLHVEAPFVCHLLQLPMVLLGFGVGLQDRLNELFQGDVGFHLVVQVSNGISQ